MSKGASKGKSDETAVKDKRTPRNNGKGGNTKRRTKENIVLALHRHLPTAVWLRKIRDVVGPDKNSSIAVK